MIVILRNGIDDVCISLAKLVGPQEYYELIQDAYDVIPLSNTDTIHVQAVAFGDSLIFDRNVTVTLKGGYEKFFSEPSTGQTLIFVAGGPALTISDGTVIIENIILQ